MAWKGKTSLEIASFHITALPRSHQPCMGCILLTISKAIHLTDRGEAKDMKKMPSDPHFKPFVGTDFYTRYEPVFNGNV
jgi:hypothetical protein